MEADFHHIWKKTKKQNPYFCLS